MIVTRGKQDPCTMISCAGAMAKTGRGQEGGRDDVTYQMRLFDLEAGGCTHP